MTLHRVVVSLMLAMTTALALLYVSTFPAPSGAAPGGGSKGSVLESGKVSPAAEDPMSRPTEPDRYSVELRIA